MSVRVVVFVSLLTGCVPWNEIHGPTVGAGVVYQRDRGLSPQLTAGYAYERFRSWYGYGADAEVGVEPWRHRVSITPRVIGSLLFWELAMGPTMSWQPGDLTFGIAISGGARVALGARNTCMTRQPPCIGENDTVPLDYLPRLDYTASFLRDGTVPMSFGGDLVFRP